MHAIQPERIVISNWLPFSITVMNVACMRLPSFRWKTLPAYSPILLGVKKLIVSPEKTASSDLPIEIGSILLIINLHFIASTDQLTIIITKTIKKRKAEWGCLTAVT